MAERCRLCGREVSGRPVEDPDGSGTFCSTGCRDVHETLGPPAGDDAPAGDRDESDGGTRSRADGTVSTFLRVDGMHAATCEAFLESVAVDRSGVRDAEASYVTESIRVEHDPDRASPDELRDALSTTGYTAYRRDDASADDSTGPTRRSREMSGVRKRRSEDVMDVRYALGVVFGTFLLVPYVALLYPSYLASLYPVGVLENFREFSVAGSALFLRVYVVLTGVVLYVAGKPLLRGAYVSLKLRRPNATLLGATAIVGAYLSGTVAVAVGSGDVYYDLVIVIATLVSGAILYESSVKQRAVDRLTELTVSQVDSARRYEADGSTSEVAVEDLAPDDLILVRRGERVPIDGALAEGTCTVDEAVVTGESVPIVKEAGDEVVGGSVVTADAAVVRVGDPPTSSVDRLTTSVWDLQSADHGIQRRTDRFAARILPLLVGAAVLAGSATLLRGTGPVDAVLALLATLVVASPWLLAVATPLSIATGVAEALERGVVVFDETVFERLREIDVVVFDKTGTLTRGRMDVLEADAPDALLAAAGALERRAAHPAADAIASAFAPESGEGGGPRTDGGTVDERDAAPARVEDFANRTNGVEGTVDGERVMVGHPDCFDEQGWDVPDAIERRVREAREAGRLPIAVGRDGEAAGVIVVGDRTRPNWAASVETLGERGIDVIVLTGDDEAVTDAFAAHPHVERVFAGVPPAGKTAAIRRLRDEGRVAMVGDGTNDALALAAADLGISLGGGTALAADAADLAIVDDDLEGVATAFDLSAAAGRRFRRNARLALSYNALAIPVALVGALNPLTAAAAAGASVLLLAASATRPLLAE